MIVKKAIIILLIISATLAIVMIKKNLPQGQCPKHCHGIVEEHSLDTPRTNYDKSKVIKSDDDFADEEEHKKIVEEIQKKEKSSTK